MAGLTAEGFEPKTRAEVLTEMESGWTSAFGTGPGRVAIKFLGVFATVVAGLWSVASAVYQNQDPDQAEGVGLDNLCKITGTQRERATKSFGGITLTGDEGATIPKGSIVKSKLGDDFVTLLAVTLPESGTATVAIEAEIAGYRPAAAGEITQIVTPIDGWDAVTNTSKVTDGRNEETDALLRLRRRESLQASGSAVDQAIRARLEALPEVVTASVRSNRSLGVDVEGLPPKSFRAVIFPNPVADEAIIAQTIWKHQPAGIESAGSVVHTVTDSQGYEQTVKFDYASPISIYVAVTRTKTATYPADGDDKIKTAIASLFSTLSVGNDLLETDLERAIYSALPQGSLSTLGVFHGTTSLANTSGTRAVAGDEYVVLADVDNPISIT